MDKQMALHLIKLCVGCDSTEDLRNWIAQTKEPAHITRMMPKRSDELLDGGSLYWVIKGRVACRQKLISITSFKDHDGISRCRLGLNNKVIPVATKPIKPFQGWRYLDAANAPPDVSTQDDFEEMPSALRNELTALGLL